MGARQKYTDEFLKSKTFGHLTFISRTPSTKIGKWYSSQCKWKCICGNEVFITPFTVVSGRNKSCGCHQHNHRNKINNNNWKGCEDISGHDWGIILRGAKKRKLEVTVTLQDAWELFIKQNRRCALTGDPLNFDSSWRKNDGNASLDRIDSTKGYIQGNIQWVNKKINMMKNCYSQDEFISLCKKVVTHNNA